MVALVFVLDLVTQELDQEQDFHGCLLVHFVDVVEEDDCVLDEVPSLTLGYLLCDVQCAALELR